MFEKITNHLKWIILVTCAAIGINITYPSTDIPRINIDPIFNLLALGLIICFCLILKNKIYRYPNLFDWVVGALFALTLTVTKIINVSEVPNGISYFHGAQNIILDIISIVGWTILFTFFFNYIQLNFGKQSSNSYQLSFKNIWLIIIICWLITTLGFLPGQISWDGLKQLCEFDHTSIARLHFTYSPTNHHPWFVTLIFGSLFSLGKIIGGANFGVFTIILFQVIVSSLIYTRAVEYVWNKIGTIGGVLTLILFASPIFSTYAVTVDKSTLYYAFAVFFYISFLEFIDTSLSINAIQANEILFYILSCVLFSAFRNDSFIIVVVSLVICFVVCLVNHKKLMAISVIFLTVLLTHIGWNAYLNQNNITKSALSEAITLPTRQLSYVAYNDPNDLTKKQLHVINKITPINKIKKNFNISNGDNLKNLYPANTFLDRPSIIKDVVNKRKSLKTTPLEKRETIDYLKVWAYVGLRHFGSYVKVYLGANTLYLNPFITYGNGLFLNYFDATPYFMHPSWYKQYHPLFPQQIRKLYRYANTIIVSLPPLALLLNAGTGIWISLLLLCITIRKRNHFWWILLPQLLMCALVTIVSVNGYTRYTIGLLATLPITISYIWQKISSQEVNHSNVSE